MSATTADFDARLGWRKRAVWLVAMVTLASVVVGMADTAPASGQAGGGSCGLDVALVLDSSGSIHESELVVMRDAFSGFVDALLPATPSQIAVVEFDNFAEVLQGFTSDATAVKDSLELLKRDRRTNWQDALLVARGLFPHSAAPDLIVFASDGRPNKVNGSKVFDREAGLAAAVVEADAAKAAGARIIAIGIESGLRVENLEAIASSSEDVYTTDDFEGLVEILAEIAIDRCRGTITVNKLVDADGSLATTGDQTPGEGWVFWPEVPIGSVDPERAATNETGSVLFTVTPDIAPGASEETLVNLFEISQAGYSLLGASCAGATDNGTSNGMDAVSGIVIGPEDVVECTFINASDSVTGGE